MAAPIILFSHWPLTVIFHPPMIKYRVNKWRR